MSSTYILDNAEEGFSDRMDFFNVPPVDTSVTEVYVQEFDPINPISDRSNITFDIQNQTGEYIDLKNTRVITTLLLRGDDGKAIQEIDDVTLINMPCVSIYRQMEVKLQKTAINTGVGANLPYKGVLDTLLGYGVNDYLSWFSLGGFFKDTATVMDNHESKGSANSGLVARNRLTKAGREVELISPLVCDLAEQNKLLINGVNLTIKLYPANEDFRLMYKAFTPTSYAVDDDDNDTDTDNDTDDSDDCHGGEDNVTGDEHNISKGKRKKQTHVRKSSIKKSKKKNKGRKKTKRSNTSSAIAAVVRTSKKYSVSIKSVVLSIPFVKVNNATLEVVSKRLERNHAVYPFMKSEVIAFNIPVGSYKWGSNQVFQDSIPDTVVIALVSGKAYNGDHTKNPFNFQTFNLNRISFSVNGKSVPGPPLEPDYKETEFSRAYATIFESRPPWQKEAPGIQLSEYAHGYAIYVFDIEKHRAKDFSSPMRTGNTKVEIGFADKTTESINVIVYGKIPSVFKIDDARNVYLENQA